MLDFQCMFGHWDRSYSSHLASCTVWAACCNVSQDLGKTCQSRFALQLDEIPACWMIHEIIGRKTLGISSNIVIGIKGILKTCIFKNRLHWINEESLPSHVSIPDFTHTLAIPKRRQKIARWVAGWHPGEAPGVCLGSRVSFPWILMAFCSFAIEQQYVSIVPPRNKNTV